MAENVKLGGLLKKTKKKKIRRGGKKFKTQSFVMISTNSAGLKSKMESLKNEVKSLNAAVFTVQETHFNKKGKFKMDNYEIFEAIRNKHNGGTMIGVHKALAPMLIKDYSDDFELVVVEIQIRNKGVRIISGYGPQESWSEAERLPFFLTLEEEIIKAEMEGVSIIIEMDSNSKLGPIIIPKDPHKQSVNGKLLADIIQRHGLVVANGLDGKCSGAITRRRETVESIEESIIDHVILSSDLIDDLESIHIDEERVHVLTSIMKKKKKVIKKQSDHNVIISKFKFSWNKRIRSNRIEMYNLKNLECQAKFKQLTNSSDNLSAIFDNEENLDKATELFIDKLNQYIGTCFRKIRICDKPNKQIDELFAMRKELRSKSDELSKQKLMKVEEKLADLCAENNYNKIKEETA